MPGPHGERCNKCIWWEFNKSNFGFCRKNAPRPTPVKADRNDEFQLVWPSTGLDDWCGNFEQRIKLEAPK
jgi:hypothetical protein